MEKLKFNYLRIIFVDGRSVEFFNSGIDHIETYANKYAGFVLECLVTLENICEDMDDINAEHFKEKCVMEFEVLGDVTGHEIL